MSSLVNYLCKANHPVEASLRPEQSAKYLKDCIDRNFVHVKFTDTRGGTELGFQLDRKKSDVTCGDFEVPKGVVTLVGDLTLDYVRVRCVAEIDLKTLTGVGHLERVSDKSE
jgi:hypothetical protein